MKSRRFGLIEGQPQSNFLASPKDVLICLLKEVNPIQRVRLSRVSRAFCEIISNETLFKLEHVDKLKENRVIIKKLLLDSGIAEKKKENDQQILDYLSQCEIKFGNTHPKARESLEAIKEYMNSLDEMVNRKLMVLLDENTSLDKFFCQYDDPDRAAILNPLMVAFEYYYLEYLALLKEKIMNENKALHLSNMNNQSQRLSFLFKQDRQDQSIKKIYGDILRFINLTVIELKNYQWIRMSHYSDLKR